MSIANCIRKLVLSLGLMLATASALADGVIVVIGERVYEDYPLGWELSCFYTNSCEPLPGIDEELVAYIVAMGSPPPMDETFFRNYLRTMASACKKSSESCEAWGQRIITTVCTRFAYAVSHCSAAVYTETSAECSHIPSCPSP